MSKDHYGFDTAVNDFVPCPSRYTQLFEMVPVKLIPPQLFELFSGLKEHPLMQFDMEKEAFS
jgi:hypothetical protein